MTERTSERGAMLVMVALALMGLMAFSALVMDYGVLWTSREQAQTAADAAAMAGAISLTYDNTTQADIKTRARAVGIVNNVWGQPSDMLTTDIRILNCPPTLNWPLTDTCIKADAYRNQARSNSLPMMFGYLVGVTQQGVRATATARAIAANTAECLKPWVVGDKWLDTQVGGWSQTASYVPTGVAPTGGDSYVAPTATNAGTGFTAKDASGNPTYYGYQMVLKLANPGQGANEIPIESAGWAMEVCLNNDASNNSCNQPAYQANITGCTSDDVTISPPGSTCTAVDPTLGCLGVKTGSGGQTNATAVGDFITAHDPTAYWTDGGGASGWQTGRITTTMATSTRIVPIAIVDIPQYIAAGWTGGNGIARVVNIVGFFLEGTCQTVTGQQRESYLDCPNGGNAKAAIVGRMVNYPALSRGGGSVIGSFGQQIVLVR